MPRLTGNAHLGWILLILGFACGVPLDPWSLAEADPDKLVGSTRMVVRHAQAVALGMGVLQILVSLVLSSTAFPRRAHLSAAWLTACGAILYTVGYFLFALTPTAAWLTPVGAVLNLSGFLVLLVVCLRAGSGRITTLIVAVLALGMAIDVVMGLFASGPDTFLPEFLGAEDGVRLRMMRLARAAAIALSVLCLLYRELAEEAKTHPTIVRRAQLGFALGAVGMPIVLISSALVWMHFKWLLGVPALSVFAGVCVAVWLTKGGERRLEHWGWLSIAISMGVGLLIGMYAFDGPLPSPVGEYNDFPRRLSRLGHAYWIVLGLCLIFASRKLGIAEPTRAARVGVPALVAGLITTVVGIVVLSVAPLPSWILLPGPALVTGGLTLCYVSRVPPA